VSRTLGVELEGCLEAFQGILDMELAGGIDLVVNVLLGLDIDGREGGLWL
jgi:hypothetical protein